MTLSRSIHAFCAASCCLMPLAAAAAQAETPARADALAAMRRATDFMTAKVAVRGGFVWSYLPDFSRRWGELEARSTMVWVQSPGTASVGHVLLDAYHATQDERYYRAAAAAAKCLTAGQLAAGGWNYVIDFAGEASLRSWYETIGRHAWRLEEFHRYDGNATFDDSATADATRFLLRFYLEKRDQRIKAALERAVDFILDAQLPAGGWPQRFPPRSPSRTGEYADYTRHLTFNDHVTAGNVELLVLCYRALRDERLLAPIHRAMDAFLATQGAAAQPGWALQYTDDLRPTAARSYEPRALATHTTFANIGALLRFHELTGEARYLNRIAEALDWLDRVRLPPALAATTGATHPTFIELGTDRPLYLHRSGSNVVNGRYYVDYDPRETVVHYSSFRRLDVDALRARYERARQMPASAPRELFASGDAAPIFPRFYAADLFGESDMRRKKTASEVAALIAGLNAEGYWPARLSMTSHPFTRASTATLAPGDFRRTYVGDETDTSPFPAREARNGISTAAFIRHMNTLIAFVADDGDAAPK